MNEISSVSYKKPADKQKNFEETCYSFHHLIFVSKKRYKIFKNPKTREVCMEAIREMEKQYKYKIREIAFSIEGEHLHMDVDVPAKFSIMQTVQIFKSHSCSKVFEKIPNLKKRYPKGSIWSGWKHYGSIGPMTEDIVVNYIKKQDIEQTKISDF